MDYRKSFSSNRNNNTKKKTKDNNNHADVINRFFMKLFTTKSIETVKYCQEYFDFSLPSVLWTKRVAKFEVLSVFCLCYDCLISFVLLSVCCLPCLHGEPHKYANSNYLTTNYSITVPFTQENISQLAEFV